MKNRHDDDEILASLFRVERRARRKEAGQRLPIGIVPDDGAHVILLAGSWHSG
jgi:hypothetical protein